MNTKHTHIIDSQLTVINCDCKSIEEAKALGKKLGEIRHLKELIIAFKEDKEIKAYYQKRLKMLIKL